MSRRLWMDSLRANRLNGSWLRRSTKPFEHGGFDSSNLSGIERAEFTNRASDRIRGYALRNKRALFKKGNININFKLRPAKSSGVEDSGNDGAISIGKGMLRMRTGRTFATIPQ